VTAREQAAERGRLAAARTEADARAADLAALAAEVERQRRVLKTDLAHQAVQRDVISQRSEKLDRRDELTVDLEASLRRRADELARREDDLVRREETFRAQQAELDATWREVEAAALERVETLRRDYEADLERRELLLRRREEAVLDAEVQERY
jgi:hypothetical protein